MHLRKTDDQTLWNGSSVAANWTSGTAVRFSTANAFTSDFYSSNTWFEIGTKGVDELAIEGDMTVSGIGSQTLCTASDIRFAAVGVIDGSLTHPVVAAGTLGSGVAPNWGSGLMCIGRLKTADSDTWKNSNAVETSLGYQVPMTEHGIFKASNGGVTPVDNDRVSWNVRIADPHYHGFTNNLATSTTTGAYAGHLSLGAYEKVWVSIQHIVTWTNGTPTANVTGTIAAHKYVYEG